MTISHIHNQPKHRSTEQANLLGVLFCHNTLQSDVCSSQHRKLLSYKNSIRKFTIRDFDFFFIVFLTFKASLEL